MLSSSTSEFAQRAVEVTCSGCCYVCDVPPFCCKQAEQVLGSERLVACSHTMARLTRIIYQRECAQIGMNVICSLSRLYSLLQRC